MQKAEPPGRGGGKDKNDRHNKRSREQKPRFGIISMKMSCPHDIPPLIPYREHVIEQRKLSSHLLQPSTLTRFLSFLLAQTFDTFIFPSVSCLYDLMYRQWWSRLTNNDIIPQSDLPEVRNGLSHLSALSTRYNLVLEQRQSHEWVCLYSRQD